MQIFKQGNYPKTFLGATKYTVADYGCYTCVLAEINNLFGANCTPVDVAAKVNLYQKDGQIRNSVLATEAGLKNTVFVQAVGYDEALMDAVLGDWANKQIAVKVKIPKGGTHFMKLAQKNGYGRYQCHDPYSGGIVDINHYGPVLGLRLFKKRTPPLN